jgi:hypothetical protein
MTALFTGVLALLAFMQWRAMKKQADYMRDALAVTRQAADAAKDNAKAALDAAETAKSQSAALISSERAWLVISDVGPVTLNPKPGQTKFQFTLANRGRTVARLTGPFRWRFQIVPRDSGLPDTLDYGEDLNVFGERFEPVFGRVLSPGDSNTKIDFGYWEDIGEDLIGAIQMCRSKLYFYASLRYFDFADQQRELQFCYPHVRSPLPSGAQDADVRTPAGYLPRQPQAEVCPSSLLPVLMLPALSPRQGREGTDCSATVGRGGTTSPPAADSRLRKPMSRGLRIRRCEGQRGPTGVGLRETPTQAHDQYQHRMEAHYRSEIRGPERTP